MHDGRVQLFVQVHERWRASSALQLEHDGLDAQCRQLQQRLDEQQRLLGRSEEQKTRLERLAERTAAENERFRAESERMQAETELNLTELHHLKEQLQRLRGFEVLSSVRLLVGLPLAFPENEFDLDCDQYRMK